MDTSKNTDQNDAEQNLDQRYTNRLIANQLVMRQGAANSIETNELTMRQSAALKVSADQVHTNASAVGFFQADAAEIENSTIAVANIDGNVSMDQSGANLLVAKGTVSMDQSGSVLLLSRSVVMENSNTAFLFAQHVEGNVTTLFDSRDAVIFGAAAGFVGGLVILIGRIFKRRR